MKNSSKLIGLKNVRTIPTLQRQRQIRDAFDRILPVESGQRTVCLLLPMYDLMYTLLPSCEVLDAVSGDVVTSLPIGYLRDIWSEYDTRIDFYVHSDIVAALMRE